MLLMPFPRTAHNFRKREGEASEPELVGMDEVLHSSKCDERYVLLEIVLFTALAYYLVERIL